MPIIFREHKTYLYLISFRRLTRLSPKEDKSVLI